MAYAQVREARSKDRKPKMHEHHVEIHEADNDGYTVKHMMQAEPTADRPYVGSPEEGATHVFESGPAMVKHIMDHHGVTEAALAEHLKGENEEKPGGENEKQEAKAEAANREEEDEEA